MQNAVYQHFKLNHLGFTRRVNDKFVTIGILCFEE